MNQQEQVKSAAYTTLKEYDVAVRRSQRKIKELSEATITNEGLPEGVELELAKASHKFLLASRAKFKELEVNQSPDETFKDEVKQLRPEQVQAFREGFERHVAGDPGIGDTHPGATFVADLSKAANAAIKQTSKLWPAVDRSREFVPSARVIRERAHAGAMRAHKYAPDDSRAQGLGYKVRQRKADRVGFVLALGVKPIFPPMRDATCFLMRNSGRRILVNGQAW